MKLPRRLSEPGPLLEYISFMQRHPAPEIRRKAVEIQTAIKECLATEGGVMLLELLDKAVLERSVPVGSDPRALDALNAQGFIALDLRRIASNETDATLAEHPTDAGSGPRGRRRG